MPDRSKVMTQMKRDTLVLQVEGWARDDNLTLALLFACNKVKLHISVSKSSSSPKKRMDSKEYRMHSHTF
jgi:hypothetical protein